MTEEQTMTVYRDGSCSHLPGPNPGTQYTACLLDAGTMERVEHPVSHAAMWCSTCLQTVAAKDDDG